jgi:hypothetical protein
MSKKIKKKPQPYLYDGPPLSKDEKVWETDDVYDTDEREAMLDEDEITDAEEGFMKGQTQEPPSKKETKKNSLKHADTIPVELAKEDSEDD